MRAGQSPRVIDSDQHDAAVAVRQTHDGIHQVSVAQRRVTFSQKLGGELFTARKQAANVGVGEHDGQMRQEKTARIRGSRVSRSRCAGLASYPVAQRGQSRITAPSLITVFPANTASASSSGLRSKITSCAFRPDSTAP